MSLQRHPVVKRLQSVMNSCERLVFSSSSSTTSLRIFVSYAYIGWNLEKGFSTSSPFWFSNNGTASTYLVDQLSQPADPGIRSCLWSASTSSLPVRRTRLSVVGDRAFPIVAARTWNTQPRHVTSGHLWKFSVAACRPTSSGAHSLEFYSATEVT